MNMKKWKGLAALSAACLTLPVGMSLTASATTVGDVISAAYAAGWPDYLVQQAVNMYAGGNYTSEQCDAAIAQIYQYDDTVAKQIEQELGIYVPPANSGGETGNATQETPDDKENHAPANSDGSGSNAGGNETEEMPIGGVTSNAGTLGSSGQEARPSDKEFIQMTLEQKKEYLNQLPEAEKQQFVSTMTAAERNSIIKQLSSEDKAKILASFTDVGKEFGITFNIDDLSDDHVVVSARDENGKLIDVAAVGVTIDATGYGYEKPLLIAGSLLLLSVGGIAGVMLYTNKKKQIAAECAE